MENLFALHNYFLDEDGLEEGGNVKRHVLNEKNHNDDDVLYYSGSIDVD